MTIRTKLFSFSFLLIFVFLLGCVNGGPLGLKPDSSLIGPFIKDPETKLSYADVLIEQGNRIYAEYFIWEAINECKEAGDMECLAKAYLAYAIFLRHNYLSLDSKFYKKNGFRDKDITYSTRIEYADKYLEKALALKPKSEDVNDKIKELQGKPFYMS